MSTPLPLVFDGHNDTVLDLMSTDKKRRRSFFQRSERGHIDLPRIREGGSGGGLFAMYVPSLKKMGPPPERASYVAPLPESTPAGLRPATRHARLCHPARCGA